MYNPRKAVYNMVQEITNINFLGLKKLVLILQLYILYLWKDVYNTIREIPDMNFYLDATAYLVVLFKIRCTRITISVFN